MTIAPADPASATPVTATGEPDGPGAALLRTLTDLTADLPDADPGRVAAAAARPVRPRGRGRAARAGRRGGGRAHLRGPRLLQARRPPAGPRHPRRGRLAGRHLLQRFGRHRSPRGPDRRPHRRVRTAARGPPGRTGRPGRRRPLRLLRPAHRVQPLPAPAPDHPQGRRDPQHFMLRVAAGLAEDDTARSVDEVAALYGLMSRLDYLPSSPTLFNSGTRHAQMSSCYLLDSPQGRAGLHLRPLPPGRQPLQARRRHRHRLLPHPFPRFPDPRHQRPLQRHRPVPEDAGRLGRRREPGRAAQGRGGGLPGDLARGHRGVPGAAGQHRRGRPPHAQPEPGALGAGRVHAPGGRRRTVVAVLARRRARAGRPVGRGSSTPPTAGPRRRGWPAGRCPPASCTAA